MKRVLMGLGVAFLLMIVLCIGLAIWAFYWLAGPNGPQKSAVSYTSATLPKLFKQPSSTLSSKYFCDNLKQQDTLAKWDQNVDPFIQKLGTLKAIKNITSAFVSSTAAGSQATVTALGNFENGSVQVVLGLNGILDEWCISGITMDQPVTVGTFPSFKFPFGLTATDAKQNGTEVAVSPASPQRAAADHTNAPSTTLSPNAAKAESDVTSIIPSGSETTVIQAKKVHVFVIGKQDASNPDRILCEQALDAGHQDWSSQPKFAAFVTEAKARGFTLSSCWQTLGVNPTLAAFSGSASALCANALNMARLDWDSRPSFAAFVSEAKHRGYTIDSCATLLTPPSRGPSQPQSQRPVTKGDFGTYPEPDLCEQALDQERKNWDTDNAYALVVTEAKLRGYTVDTCRAILGFAGYVER
jgi:hypothetical protein